LGHIDAKRPSLSTLADLKWKDPEMKDVSNSEKRDSNGRFLPGHKPPKSPGRPPGPNGVKARAAKLAGERLEELLGKATAVIDAELEAGNAQVATWLVDRVRPVGKADFVTLDVPPPASVEDLIGSARAVNAAMLSGEISTQQAKSILDLLARQGQFEVVEDLGELREELDRLKQNTGAARLTDPSHLPTWGRLREATSEPVE
jgi:hypothetical protein